jgi:hypothetical protein
MPFAMSLLLIYRADWRCGVGKTGGISELPRAMPFIGAPCVSFETGREVMKAYTRPKRKEVIDWIKCGAMAIMQREGITGANACDAAWRRAVGTWLHRNGVITVSVDKEVLPCFRQDVSHYLMATTRLPVILHYLEGRKQEDVAAQLELTQSAVSKRLERGLEALRSQLRKQGVLVPGVALAGLLATHALVSQRPPRWRGSLERSRSAA